MDNHLEDNLQHNWNSQDCVRKTFFILFDLFEYHVRSPLSLFSVWLWLMEILDFMNFCCDQLFLKLNLY